MITGCYASHRPKVQRRVESTFFHNHVTGLIVTAVSARMTYRKPRAAAPTRLQVSSLSQALKLSKLTPTKMHVGSATTVCILNHLPCDILHFGLPLWTITNSLNQIASSHRLSATYPRLRGVGTSRLQLSEQPKPLRPFDLRRSSYQATYFANPWLE
jgi:hypothetical protein